MKHKQEDLNWGDKSLVQANLNFSYFRKDNESKRLSINYELQWSNYKSTNYSD